MISALELLCRWVQLIRATGCKEASWNKGKKGEDGFGGRGERSGGLGWGAPEEGGGKAGT